MTLREFDRLTGSLITLTAALAAAIIRKVIR